MLDPLWRPLAPLDSSGSLVVGGGGGAAPGVVRLPLPALGALGAGSDWYCACDILAWVVCSAPAASTVTMTVHRALSETSSDGQTVVTGEQLLATVVGPAVGVGVSLQTTIPAGGGGGLVVRVSGTAAGTSNIIGGGTPLAPARASVPLPRAEEI